MTEEEKQALLKSASDAAAAAAAEVLKKAEVKLPEVEPAPHVPTKEEADAAIDAARAKALADAQANKDAEFQKRASAGVAQFLKDEKEKKYGGREI